METPSGEQPFETTTDYGWEEGAKPTVPSTSKTKIEIPKEVYFIIPVGMILILCIFVEYRYRPIRRFLRRLFGKKTMLSPEETRLKELYEQRLQAEENLLKENKTQQGTNVPKNKED